MEKGAVVPTATRRETRVRLLKNRLLALGAGRAGFRLILFKNNQGTVFTNVAAWEGISRTGDGTAAGRIHALPQAGDSGFDMRAWNKNIDFSAFRLAGIVASGTGGTHVEGLLLPAVRCSAAGG